MESILGGVMIGVAASCMLLFNGRVTGISGILGGLLKNETLDKNWRFLFLLGLILGGFMLRLFYPTAFTIISSAQIGDYILAGLLVGFGTLLGSGCTSGHGVCGLSRFSLRSLAATVTFIAFGILGLLLFKLIRGGV
jgi:uncharacterized membrane protein YedE/YeeE